MVSLLRIDVSGGFYHLAIPSNERLGECASSSYPAHLGRVKSMNWLNLEWCRAEPARNRCPRKGKRYQKRLKVCEERVR